MPLLADTTSADNDRAIASAPGATALKTNRRGDFASTPASAPNMVPVHATARLDALTSLRFFAAWAIVVYHAVSHLTPGATATFIQQNLRLFQGVSFFYVLSGFVLTYVYPQLSGAADIARFLKARLARVYPSYVVGYILTAPIAELPSGIFLPFSLLFLTMTQDWVPITHCYWSFNPPGWSISCEFFFYLAFPLLIAQFATTYKRKVATCILLGAAVMTSGAIFAGRHLFGFEIAADWFRVLSPALRLIEFTIGMCTALAFKEWQRKRTVEPAGTDAGSSMATTLEATVLALTGAYCFCAANYSIPFLPFDVNAWLGAAGGAPIYAAVIYLFGKQQGWFSRRLSTPLFVLLGEISYAIYLLHYCLLLHVARDPSVLHLPAPLRVSLYCILLFAASYLCFELVEKPFRKLIVSNSLRQFQDSIKSTNKLALVVASLLAIVSFSGFKLYSGYFNADNSLVMPKLVRDIKQATPVAIRDSKFGEAFVLRGFQLEERDGKPLLKLAWAARKETPLKYNVGVHMVDAGGNTIGYGDFNQSEAPRSVKAKESWVDQRVIEPAILQKTAQIGICIYEPGTSSPKCFEIDKGPRDCGQTRLLIDKNELLQAQTINNSL